MIARNFSLFLTLLVLTEGCSRIPSVYHSTGYKRPGDNGVRIRISGNPDRYTPGKTYTMNLMTSSPSDQSQRFKKFILNAESATKIGDYSPQSVGSFQLFRDSPATFKYECVNTLSEINDTLKSEVFFMWTAPPSRSGCITFRAMVLKDRSNWFADEGGLTKTLCEMTEMDVLSDPNECCACEEAVYDMVFEGIWSSETHPKDYPTLLWLTHFSDVIGASHERNFTFWGEGQIASEGFRSLAEWGSIRLMETELRAKSKYLRTIIKAAGLWYPQVNANTSAKFKVDRRHSLVSLASMFGPTPDWVVGVNGYNLCLKNCSWMESAIVDLYPYDAGTDSGITYMSPNAETAPRERIYRITTTYPEDPRAPFYDPKKKEMKPLARLYLKRDKVIPRKCDETFLNAQLDISENTEDTNRAECAVTEYSEWSNCSVSCGKGLRMRKREYRLPQKAAMFNCNRQLVSKEMCVAAIPECPNNENAEEDLSVEAPLPEDDSGFCATTPWESWSSCSATCGIGFRMRNRHFVNKMGRKKCPHIINVEKEKCMRPACTAESAPGAREEDTDCPTTEWSEWSPCSVSCGRGFRFRTRLLLAEPSMLKICNAKVKMMEKVECSDIPDCTLDAETARVVCLQEKKEVGDCQGNFSRWYYDKDQSRCSLFSYSGCRGNRNNFATREECVRSCDNSTKIDCVVSAYTDWSPCSATCGLGMSVKTREILVEGRNGGRACPKVLKKIRRCRGPECTRFIRF